MKMIIGLIMLTAIISTASAESSLEYTVTGEAHKINSFYHDALECHVAIRDAVLKADLKCKAEGFTAATNIDGSECINKLFGGKKVTATFFCE